MYNIDITLLRDKSLKCRIKNRGRDMMKQRIWKVFYNELTKTDLLFKDLRVNDICVLAGIHRSTFYRHFEDKYQLLEYGLSDLWQEYFLIGESQKIKEPFQISEAFYQESKGRELINHHILDEKFIDAVNQFFRQKMKSDISNELERQGSQVLPVSLVSEFLIGVILSVEKWGKEQQPRPTSKELDNYYQKLVFQSLDLDLGE